MFTALVIAMLVLVGATGAIGGALMMQARRRLKLEGASVGPRQLGAGAESGAGGAGATAMLERGFAELRPGDIVQHVGRDFLVEGVLRYEEAGHRWTAGRVVDGKEVKWLVADLERAGANDLLLLEEDPDIEVGSYPPEVVMAADQRYRLDRRGTATVQVLGDVGGISVARGLSRQSVLRCRWWRYEAAGDGRLLIEDWSGDFRALRGAAVQSGVLEFMPGS